MCHRNVAGRSVPSPLGGTSGEKILCTMYLIWLLPLRLIHISATNTLLKSSWALSLGPWTFLEQTDSGGWQFCLAPPTTQYWSPHRMDPLMNVCDVQQSSPAHCIISQITSKRNLRDQNTMVLYKWKKKSKTEKAKFSKYKFSYQEGKIKGVSTKWVITELSKILQWRLWEL